MAATQPITAETAVPHSFQKATNENAGNFARNVA